MRSLVGSIDAAQQPDQRPILRNRGDRHRRRGTGEHGRFEFRLRQHDGGGRPAKSSENKGCESTLTRYVSLSGKAAPRPCAQVIRELRPARQCLVTRRFSQLGRRFRGPVMIAAAVFATGVPNGPESPVFHVFCSRLPAPRPAAGPSGAQEKGAEAFLAAVASGNAQAIAQELHPGRARKAAQRACSTLLRAESLAQRQHLSLAVVWTRPLARRPREHDGGALLRRAVRSPAPARARIRRNSTGWRAVPDGKVVYLRRQGRAAEGTRLGQGHGHRGADAVRRAVARRHSERDRSAARRPARRPHRGRAARRPAARTAAAAAAAAGAARARHQRIAGARRSQPRRRPLRGVLQRVHEPELQQVHVAQRARRR